jgi:ketosteroid isomerase-like protein
MGGEPVEVCGDIEHMLERMAEAVSTGDFEKWRTLWHPDAHQYAPNTPAAVGLTNITYGAQAWFREWTHEMSIRCDEVQTAGVWAFASGSLTLRSVARCGEKVRLHSARFLAVLIDRGGGHWVLYRYCYNSSVPPADRQ